MSEPLLDREELMAIRQTIGEAAAPSRNPAPASVMPIPLIADDRAAERARPIALRLAQRWARNVPARLGRLCSVKPTVAEVSCEAIDAETARHAFSPPFQTVMTAGDPARSFLFGIGGAMIESIAARLLGAADSGTSERVPSATTLRIFTPAGETMMKCLDEAWHHEQGGNVARRPEIEPTAWLREIEDGEVLMSLRIRFEDPAGQLALVTRPEMFLSPLPPLKIVAPPRGAIEKVLGEVPVEVTVEVGRAKLTMRELASLRPGEVIPLYQQVEGLMPVRLGGVVKAHGKAIVSSGAFALEVTRSQKSEKGQ